MWSQGREGKSAAAGVRCLSMAATTGRCLDLWLAQEQFAIKHFEVRDCGNSRELVVPEMTGVWHGSHLHWEGSGVQGCP